MLLVDQLPLVQQCKNFSKANLPSQVVKSTCRLNSKLLVDILTQYDYLNNSQGKNDLLVEASRLVSGYQGNIQSTSRQFVHLPSTKPPVTILSTSAAFNDLNAWLRSCHVSCLPPALYQFRTQQINKHSPLFSLCTFKAKLRRFIVRRIFSD